MSERTEFIVYRNPMEAAFWDTMSNGDFFPIIVGAVLCIVLVCAMSALYNRMGYHYTRSKAGQTLLSIVFWGVSAGVPLFVVYKMYSAIA